MIEYFAIITISKSISNGTGAAQCTITCTIRVRPGTTESAIFEHVLKKVPHQYDGGHILFYRAVPNQTAAPSPGGAS